MKRKKDYIEILNKYVPERNPYYIRLLMKYVGWNFSRKNNVFYSYEFNKEDYLNKQVCLIGDHSSRNNFYYAINGYDLTGFNVMLGYQNFFDKNLFKFFMLGGAIPKLLYAHDIKAVKDTLRLAKKGASILFFPEGIRSTIGTTHPMNPATLKFLKKLDMDVILCQSKGSYLSNPRTVEEQRKGHVEYNYLVLFTKEELRTMSLDDMYERYLSKFEYNDFKWNKEKQYSYKGKIGNAKGFDKLLYKCPICEKENCITTTEEYIECTNCHNKVYIDDKYNMKSEKPLSFDTIDRWYYYERESIRKEVLNNDFSLEFNVILRTIDRYKLHEESKRYIEIGRGKLIIDKVLIKYIGTKDNENTTIELDYSLTPSAPLYPGLGISVYDKDIFYLFEFIDNKNLAPKATMAIEEIHNLSDEAWDKVSKDVYK